MTEIPESPMAVGEVAPSRASDRREEPTVALFGNTRSRIVAAAMQLFAERGYGGTSVADLQGAAGLTTGSGALYKHFKSKREVLDAVAQVHIDAIHEYMDRLDDTSEADPLDQLVHAARLVWTGISENRELIRIMYRDLEESPSSLDAIWDAVDQRVFIFFTRVVERGIGMGVFKQVNPDQTALVLVSALLYLPSANALIGHQPSSATTSDDYLECWVSVARCVLLKDPS